jgi:hypothetical protein
VYCVTKWKHWQSCCLLINTETANWKCGYKAKLVKYRTARRQRKDPYPLTYNTSSDAELFLELTVHRNESFVRPSNTFTSELRNTVTSGLTLKGAYVRAFSSTNWRLSHFTHHASIFRLLLLLVTPTWSSLLSASTANGDGLRPYQNTGDHSPKHSRQPRTILTKQTDTPNATLLSRISANRYCLWINLISVLQFSEFQIWPHACVRADRGARF